MSELSVVCSLAAAGTELPLCVDLDGTLVKSDTFLDSLAILARRNPLAFLRAPLWMLRGKAHCKAKIASLVTLDAEYLPYNQPLLRYLRDEHSYGRKLFLVTGADRELASQVANRLGFFDGVLASDGVLNLTGKSKLAQLEVRFGADGFAYIGNALPDLPVLAGASEAMLANPDLRLKVALRNRRIRPSHVFIDRGQGLKTLANSLRIHQWAKNVLVFLPMLLAHTLQLTSALFSLAAFFAFCAIASATYIVNDLLDLEADRTHPNKRKRALASGNLSIGTGLALSGLLAILSVAFAAWLPPRFWLFLFAYLVTTLSYSLWLKRIALVDVLVLSGLYTVRMIAGGEATGVRISPWLSAFSIFFFLSLAMVKRFSELKSLHERGASPSRSRGYLLSDLEQIRSFGTASAYASIVIFALYINGHDVAVLYRHPNRMWLNTPLMLLWVSRVWLLASRGDLHEDPVVFALTDRTSILLGLGIALVVWSAL